MLTTFLIVLPVLLIRRLPWAGEERPLARVMREGERRKALAGQFGE